MERKLNNVVDWLDDNITLDGIVGSFNFLEILFSRFVNCVSSTIGMLFLVLLFVNKYNVTISTNVRMLIIPTILLMYIAREKYGVVFFDVIYLVGALYLIPETTNILTRYPFFREVDCEILKLIFIVGTVIDFSVRLNNCKKVKRKITD